MTSDFVYNVPYFDFTNGHGEDIQNAEAFFEIEHANHNDISNKTKESYGEESQFYTPLKSMSEKEDGEEDHYGLRKSLSMAALPIDNKSPEVETENMAEINETLQELNIEESSRKSHMRTRVSVSKSKQGRSSSASRIFDRLAQPKNRKLVQEKTKVEEYISMAEAVRRFHQKTPLRFRTKAHNKSSDPSSKPRPFVPATIPHSPNLTTKQRIRSVHALTREEQELREFEEAKKFEIKAHPVNKKILNGPLPLKFNNEIVKKPLTVQEPFNLTQISNRKISTLPDLPETKFHARPVPKCVLQPPAPIIKNTICTVPCTPKLMKRYTVNKPEETIIENEQKRSASQPLKASHTVPVPFSFAERDKEIIKKKEQLIQGVLEEEKKAREFHARPLPKSILRSPQMQSKMNCSHYRLRQRSVDSFLQSKDKENMSETFKARPASVLHIKPFEPKKEEGNVTEIAEFNLSTTRRAKEREEFEKSKKEKEVFQSEWREMHKQEEQRRQEEESARLRKEMEFKANPIRSYKEVKQVIGKKITIPLSPKFMTDKIRNKE